LELVEVYLPLSTQAAVKRSDHSVWMPHSQKGEKGRQREESLELEQVHIQISMKKRCDPEPPSALGMCWTAPISASLAD